MPTLRRNCSFAENRLQCHHGRCCVDGVFDHIWASSGRSVPIRCLQQGPDIKESELQFHGQSIYVGGSHSPGVDQLPIFSISAFTIGDNTSALHHFAVILDPLSEQAQRYTSLFEVFTELTIPLRLLRSKSIVAFSHSNCHRGISLAATGVLRGALPMLTCAVLLYRGLAAAKTVLPL